VVLSHLIAAHQLKNGRRPILQAISDVQLEQRRCYPSGFGYVFARR
jgi:hypothetical protein